MPMKHKAYLLLLPLLLVLLLIPANKSKQAVQEAGVNNYTAGLSVGFYFLRLFVYNTAQSSLTAIHYD